MGHTILIAQKERERAALLQLAHDLLQAGESTGSPLSPEEDARVTDYVKRAQALEHEIGLLQRDRKKTIPSKHHGTEDA
jgi:hypothetical protein